ncbi:MAG: hypothetical protein M3N38_03610 [Pseudomonadota bacterium]|nr:hypothetical protein [Pseudomonadota bacterium]
MIHTAIIGLAAAAALTIGASTASAGVDVHFNVGPGYGYGFGGYPYGYPPYHPAYHPGYADPDCHYVTKWKWVKKANGNLKKKYYKKLVCY